MKVKTHKSNKCYNVVNLAVNLIMVHQSAFLPLIGNVLVDDEIFRLLVLRCCQQTPYIQSRQQDLHQYISNLWAIGDTTRRLDGFLGLAPYADPFEQGQESRLTLITLIMFTETNLDLFSSIFYLPWKTPFSVFPSEITRRLLLSKTSHISIISLFQWP